MFRGRADPGQRGLRLDDAVQLDDLLLDLIGDVRHGRHPPRDYLATALPTRGVRWPWSATAERAGAKEVCVRSHLASDATAHDRTPALSQPEYFASAVRDEDRRFPAASPARAALAWIGVEMRESPRAGLCGLAVPSRHTRAPALSPRNFRREELLCAERAGRETSLRLQATFLRLGPQSGRHQGAPAPFPPSERRSGGRADRLGENNLEKKCHRPLTVLS